jgi:hypothetical protein
MGLTVRQSKEVKNAEKNRQSKEVKNAEKNHIYQYCKALLVTMNYL